MGVNDEIADRLIGNAVNLERFSAALRMEVLGHLALLEQRLVKAIERMKLDGAVRSATKRARAERLLRQVRDTIRKGYQVIDKVHRTHMVELSKHQGSMIQQIGMEVFKSSVLSVALTPTDLRVIASDTLIMGAPSRDWWKRQAEGTRMGFEREVRQGLLAGETTDQIVRRVRGSQVGRHVLTIDGQRRVLPKFQGGVMAVPTRQAEALVRTSVQTVSNEVLEQTYRENSDVVKAMRAIATLDGRTSDICKARDGALWDLETGKALPESPVAEPFPGHPPWHFSCRTVLGPVTKSWAELIEEGGGEVPPGLHDVPPSTRASMDGQVPATRDYSSWLKTKPEAFQREVLGAGKFELWKNGKLTHLSQLLDQTGNPLTLKQLKAKLAQPVRSPETVQLPKVKPKKTQGTPKGITKDPPDSWDPLDSKQAFEAARKAHDAEFAKAWREFERLVPEAAAIPKHYVGPKANYELINGYLRNDPRLAHTLATDVAKDPSARYWVRSERNHLAREQLIPHLEQAKKNAALMQQAAAKAPPTRFDMTVFRGDKITFPETGSIQTMKGFTSTSLSPRHILDEFAPGSAQVFYEIKIPAGSRGVLTGFNPAEAEVLLPHGAKFRVLGQRVEKIRGIDRQVFQLEYLGV